MHPREEKKRWLQGIIDPPSYVCHSFIKNALLQMHQFSNYVSLTLNMENTLVGRMFNLALSDFSFFESIL